ncbi:hypothetical protein CYMTET_51519 [Cymbomonas tetramitiformis]|uniref:Uncharacterized protein n=1 Tax=Cymbomonas tetramitiformis TaxID=36881 RepID=A0AAE0BL39_9CHLO|nr:hypothetical protein CYMTET_51519 [Cymbomonas tetramitiformis]
MPDELEQISFKMLCAFVTCYCTKQVAAVCGPGRGGRIAAVVLAGAVPDGDETKPMAAAPIRVTILQSSDKVTTSHFMPRRMVLKFVVCARPHSIY